MKFTIAVLLLMIAPAAYCDSPKQTTQADATDKSSEKKTTKPGKPVIKLGMSPDEVVKIIGKPDKKEKVDTPAGKGEQWTYRRLAKEWTTQTAATVDTVPAYVGLAMPNEGIGETSVPSNHIENVKVFQVSSLLFIEGKLAAAKQWPEKEKRIEN